jgi:hypothetical protein
VTVLEVSPVVYVPRGGEPVRASTKIDDPGKVVSFEPVPKSVT